MVSTYLKNKSQIGSFPKVRVKKKMFDLKPPPAYSLLLFRTNASKPTGFVTWICPSWDVDMFFSKTDGSQEVRDFLYMGGFLKCWVSPTSMGFPIKNAHFGVFRGYHHLRKHPYDFPRIFFGLQQNSQGLFSISRVWEEKKCHANLWKGSWKRIPSSFHVAIWFAY